MSPLALLGWALRRALGVAAFEEGFVSWIPDQVGDDIGDVGDDKSKNTALKVMTYNIGFGGGLEGLRAHRPDLSTIRQNLDHIIAAIRGENPDILGVQEIDIASHRSTFIDEVALIAKEAGFAYYAVAYTWDRRWVPYPTTLDFRAQFGRTLAGQVVFSKFPIRSQRILRFSKPAKNSWIYNLFYLDRVAQILEIETVAGTPIQVVNVHFEAWDKDERAKQAAALMATLPQRERTIVMGDFNTIPDSASQRDQFEDDPRDDYRGDVTFSILSGVFREVLPEVSAWSFPADKPSRRLDFIFYGEGLECLSAGIVGNAGWGSDHLPVCATMQMTGSPPSRG